MTSRKIEDVHLELLKKLLSDSGVECVRSPPVSLESSSSSGAAEEAGQAEEEEGVTETPEEKEAPFVEEESIESIPEIFPTPSLRYVLPDNVREIEKQNRIHVLPEEFKTNFDPQAIPKIMSTPQQKYIDILAEMVGCIRYKTSLAEFWFLDTMANLLRRAQEDELDRPTQAILMLWFCEWIKEMQHFDAADRKRMMRRFQDNMLEAAKFLAETDKLPTPKHAGVYYKAQEDSQNIESRADVHNSGHAVHFEGSTFKCSLRDLTKIIHYIFDLFSTDYQYNLVRSVFTFTPDYSIIDTPYQIQNPKRLYAPLKVKAKKPGKSPKKDAKGAKGKKKVTDDTEEYLALMQLKANEERILEELEEKDRESWNRRSHILPLTFAVAEEFFNKYWPPPTPEAEPEPIPDAGKGKSGKKKDKKKK